MEGVPGPSPCQALAANHWPGIKGTTMRKLLNLTIAYIVFQRSLGFAVLDSKGPHSRLNVAPLRVSTDVAPERTRAASANDSGKKNTRFQRRLLKARIEADLQKSSKKDATRKGKEVIKKTGQREGGTQVDRKDLFHQRLLAATIKYIRDAKKRAVENKRAAFQNRLLEAHIRMVQRLPEKEQHVKEENRPEEPLVEDDTTTASSRTRFHFQKSLLEARLRNDEKSKYTCAKKEWDLVHQQLLEVQIRNNAVAAQDREDKRKIEFQERLLGARIKYDRRSKLIGSVQDVAVQDVSVQDVARSKEFFQTDQYLDRIQSDGKRSTVKDEAVPDLSADSLVGRTVLGKFVLTRELGGAASDKCDLFVAYRVTDNAKRNPLVVKLTPTERTEQIAIEYNIYQDLFSRLSTEEEQNLFVRIFDWIEPSPETNGMVGFVMEAGFDNLRGYIWNTGRFTGDDLRRSMHNVIKVAHALHSRGVVWTELKAENFIVFASGEIKGADLESVAAHEERLRMYTAETYPPEFPADMLYKGLPNIPLDYSYDLWGLGLTLYEMAVGHPFYTLEMTYDVEYIKHRLKDPHGIIAEAYVSLSNVNEGARNVILQCLTLDPRLRRSCEDLLNDPYFAIRSGQSSVTSGARREPTAFGDAHHSHNN